MKTLLLQHKNKIAFFTSFFIHLVFVVYFLKFEVKASEVKNDKAISVLFYTPSMAVKEEVIESSKEVVEEFQEEIAKEEIIEEPLAIKPKKKHFKKPKKIIKKEVKKEIKKDVKKAKEEIKNESTQETKQESTAQINQNADHQNTTKDDNLNKETLAGGNTKDEFITHIQSTLNKAAKKNYPISSRKKREQGVVVIAFTYDYGEIKNIRIIKPSKYESLNQAGIKSVKNAKFKKFERILDINVPLKFSLY